VFGAGFGRGGDEGDRLNRELFEEQMQIMRLAWEESEFCFHGKHYNIPPEGILNTGNAETGRPWDKISLVPQPKRPIQIYQACNSDETLRKCAIAGNTGVIPLRHDLQKMKQRWDEFGEILEAQHGRSFAPGEKRLLVVSAHIGADRASAVQEVAVPVIERQRFLAQQRAVGAFPDGTPYPVGYVPGIEETLDRGNLIVGSAEEVRDRIVEIVETLGVQEIAVEMGFPGMVEEQVARQIELFAEGVRPALDRAGAPAASVSGATP
jgi:alkanesulfonate monooxygenase SsuD/methylene tetrahydromethanopterin reductase-like flavin-dependent oxidoreductase (luciferase family)